MKLKSALAGSVLSTTVLAQPTSAGDHDHGIAPLGASPQLSADEWWWEPLLPKRRLYRREPNPEVMPQVPSGQRALPQLEYFTEAPDWGGDERAIRSRVNVAPARNRARSRFW